MINSVPLTGKNIKTYNCIVIVTDHSLYDRRWLAKESRLLVASRGAVKGMNGKNIVRA